MTEGFAYFAWYRLKRPADYINGRIFDHWARMSWEFEGGLYR